MQASFNELEEKAKLAKSASKKLAFMPTGVKNQALLAIAQALLDREDQILHDNEKDYKEAEASGMGASMLDRLMLNSTRLKGISDDVKTVAALPDPVGEIIEERTLPNGLLLSKRRVPLGVIGAIYESRPNVTVDISVLCLKAGNACVLRGGKESSRSNLALAGVVQEAAYKAGIPRGSVQFIESPGRETGRPHAEDEGVYRPHHTPGRGVPDQVRQETTPPWPLWPAASASATCM